MASAKRSRILLPAQHPSHWLGRPGFERESAKYRAMMKAFLLGYGLDPDESDPKEVAPYAKWFARDWRVLSKEMNDNYRYSRATQQRAMDVADKSALTTEHDADSAEESGVVDEASAPAKRLLMSKSRQSAQLVLHPGLMSFTGMFEAGDTLNECTIGCDVTEHGMLLARFRRDPSEWLHATVALTSVILAEAFTDVFVAVRKDYPVPGALRAAAPPYPRATLRAMRRLQQRLAPIERLFDVATERGINEEHRECTPEGVSTLRAVRAAAVGVELYFAGLLIRRWEPFLPTAIRFSRDLAGEDMIEHLFVHERIPLPKNSPPDVVTEYWADVNRRACARAARRIVEQLLGRTGDAMDNYATVVRGARAYRQPPRG